MFYTLHLKGHSIKYLKNKLGTQQKYKSYYLQISPPWGKNPKLVEALLISVCLLNFSKVIVTSNICYTFHTLVFIHGYHTMVRIFACSLGDRAKLQSTGNPAYPVIARTCTEIQQLPIHTGGTLSEGFENER